MHKWSASPRGSPPVWVVHRVWSVTGGQRLLGSNPPAPPDSQRGLASRVVQLARVDTPQADKSLQPFWPSTTPPYSIYVKIFSLFNYYCYYYFYFMMLIS